MRHLCWLRDWMPPNLERPLWSSFPGGEEEADELLLESFDKVDDMSDNNDVCTASGTPTSPDFQSKMNCGTGTDKVVEMEKHVHMDHNADGKADNKIGSDTRRRLIYHFIFISEVSNFFEIFNK